MCHTTDFSGLVKLWIPPCFVQMQNGPSLPMQHFPTERSKNAGPP